MSGALWLLLLAVPWSDRFESWVLFGIGAGVRRRRQRVPSPRSTRARSSPWDERRWRATPWLVAVALWTLLLAAIDFEDSVSGWLLTLFAGLCIGTPCYLAWQIVALAVRQLVGVVVRNGTESP